MHYAAVSLVGLQVSNESTLLLSLAVDRLRTVLAVKGSLRRAEDGAPLTAPGRSEETLPNKEGKENWETYDPDCSTSRHLNWQDHVHATSLEEPAQRQGAGCRKFRGAQLAGEIFLLTSLFIEPKAHLSSEILRVFL